MKNISLCLIFLLIGIFGFAQDKIIKTNNEEIFGRIIYFDNGKFTMLLPDKTEISYPKETIKRIVFDTSRCDTNPGEGMEMNADCTQKKLGNLQFIEGTQDVTEILIRGDGYAKEFRFSKNNSPFTAYNIPEGFYYWSVHSLNVSGSFYLHKCTTKQIEVK